MPGADGWPSSRGSLGTLRKIGQTWSPLPSGEELDTPRQWLQPRNLGISRTRAYRRQREDFVRSGSATFGAGNTRHVRLALGFSLLSLLTAPFSLAAATSPQPTLRALDKAPLVLLGTGFKRVERVKVSVVTQPVQLIRTTRASRAGTFVVRFDTIVDACYGARTATAIGARGSRATIVLARPLDRYCVEPGGAP